MLDRRRSRDIVGIVVDEDAVRREETVPPQAQPDRSPESGFSSRSFPDTTTSRKSPRNPNRARVSRYFSSEKLVMA